MAKLSTTYRILVFSLLCCIFIQSVSFVTNELKHEETGEQQKNDKDTFVQAAHTEAVIPASTLQLVKWNYVFQIVSFEPLLCAVLPIEQLHLVLSYFQVLFEVCITTNAP